MNVNRLMSGALATAVALGALSTPANADTRRDLYFQQATERYFNLPQNARTFGMAGSSVATSSDVSSVIGNPAGLGFMKDGEFSGTYGNSTVSGREQPTYKEVDQNTNSGSALVAFPLGPVKDDLPDYGNLGLGWSTYLGDLGDDSYGVGDHGYRVHGAYALALSPDTTLGYSLSYFHDTYGQDGFSYPMRNGFRHTVGVQNRVDNDVSVGGSVFIGHGDHHVEFDAANVDEKSSLIEVGAEAGVGYRLEETLLTFSGDYEHYGANGGIDQGPENVVFGGDENGNAFNIRVGVEETVNDWFKVRGGYRYAGNVDYSFNRDELNDLNGSAKYNAWSLGAGVVLPIDGEYIKAVKLDYGVEYRTAGNDWEHVVTASIPFGVCNN